jgi:hypothetical protein
MNLSRRGLKRMVMQDYNLLPSSSGQVVQSLAEVNFLRDKQLLAEAAQFPKGSRLTKYKRPGHPALPSAQPTPNADHPNRPKDSFIKFNRGTAANTFATSNSRHHFGEQFRARRGIRIHKNQPLPARCRRSGIARPRDLIDGLENDARALCPGYSAGSVRRVVVANNDLMVPADLRKCNRRTLNALQRMLNKLLFVKSRNDNRNDHIKA